MQSLSRLAAAAALALLMMSWSPAARAQATPSPEVRAFDRFIATSAPLCLHEAAAACVDAAWLMADRDRDRLLSLEELSAVQRALADWARWRKPELHENDYSGIQLGLLIARSIGLERLFASLDENGDQGLTQDELLADVTLDRRPLPAILTDRSAIDWDAVSRRLGSFVGLIGGAPTSD